MVWPPELVQAGLAAALARFASVEVQPILARSALRVAAVPAAVKVLVAVAMTVKVMKPPVQQARPSRVRFDELAQAVRMVQVAQSLRFQTLRRAMVSTVAVAEYSRAEYFAALPVVGRAGRVAFPIGRRAGCQC